MVVRCQTVKVVKKILIVDAGLNGGRDPKIVKNLLDLIHRG
jgi:hypothetical protein